MFSIAHVMIMISVVSESVIPCILDFCANNNETDYQLAKACKHSTEKSEAAAWCEITYGVEAQCLASMNNSLWFLSERQHIYP